jgi:hypothetical protein
MPSYYVNTHKQHSGDHEVHKQGCSYLPMPQSRQYLGEFTNCQDAVSKAKQQFSQVNGCAYCCYECHTS